MSTPYETSTTMRRTPAVTAGGYTALDYVALVLMIVGGLNWGLVGLFQFDLVAAIFGEMTLISRAVYTLVGLAALQKGKDTNYALRRRGDRASPDPAHRRRPPCRPLFHGRACLGGARSAWRCRGI